MSSGKVGCMQRRRSNVVKLFLHRPQWVCCSISLRSETNSKIRCCSPNYHIFCLNGSNSSKNYVWGNACLIRFPSYVLGILILTKSTLKGKVSCPTTRHGGAWGERRQSSYSFLNSALDGGEWSASRPGRALLPRKGPPVPLDRRLVGPRAGLDAEAKRKILCPCRGSNPDRPTRSQTLYWLSYRGS
jgi:hypothetical protein